MKKINDKQKLAIAAIFKNEGPYILEWIAFHRTIGVDNFFIADNGSTDGSSDLLQALEKLGIITYIPFPSTPGVPPQLSAYKKIINEHISEAQWFAFIDADEFLLPTDGETSIKPALQRLTEDNSIGAIAVNWATYGSSHHKEYSADLVVERFNYRATKDFGVNRHYKSIVRSDAYVDTHENPHLFKIKEGLRYVHANNRNITQYNQEIIGLSQETCWEPFRINHYIVKSFEEFTLKKNRGRATIAAAAGLNRNNSFFQGHDRNDEKETINSNLLELIKNEINRLKQQLIQIKTDKNIIELPFPKAPKLIGCMDYAKLIGSDLEFLGWAFFDDNSPVTFHASIDNFIFETKATTKIFRPDVKRKILGAPIDCGFRTSISLSEIPRNLLHKEIYLNATTTGASYRIPAGSSYQYPLPETTKLAR
ncbi:Glycosyl transferase family 2 [Azotobacter beijerinckii]|uniref:Glycosyl transferase family 2 n=1 Tax=Azotobacter beijerinckii TaxID=170623 RepID=A0A1H9NHH7_9GAMM|nr:glycosyltransferase family 2 protein [Azotobacter beijerinckii]SER35217.1 Glycosyl transferase family 2 [Azotobacter beijerinckii]